MSIPLLRCCFLWFFPGYLILSYQIYGAFSPSPITNRAPLFVLFFSGSGQLRKKTYPYVKSVYLKDPGSMLEYRKKQRRRIYLPSGARKELTPCLSSIVPCAPAVITVPATVPCRPSTLWEPNIRSTRKSASSAVCAPRYVIPGPVMRFRRLRLL